ncbi:TPA: ABC transporter permease [Clostridioides difficile]|nr:ABC transporter permease [Clostridioides difficile]HBY2905836.1 ABC transporter permease [Clostridioides difficile]HBY2993676.1 ABC transporter permease [Clostridioides difficile]HBY2996941.1 ABC transporter permease [Clostridioides difficile]
MLKLIRCEFWKFKRRPLFVLSTLIAVIFPIVMTALYWNIPTQVNYDNLFSGIVDYGNFLLLLPILVVIATSLFFTEQDNDTLKNIVAIPVSKGKIVTAKIGVMVIISVAYTLVGFFTSLLCSKILGIAMGNILQKFALSIALGFMLLAAALPCVALVVWFNKSDLISIVITLFYTIINYVVHVADIGMLTPVGVNIGTVLPIPLINRWIYQFYEEGSGAAAEFYNTMRPYFVSTPICLCIIALIAALSILAIIKIYNHREV